MITSVIPVAVGAVGYAEPIAGGRTAWDAYDIMYPGDAGTMFHGAFTQPTVWNPIGGRYEHWTGVYFEKTTYQDVECVEVSIDPDGNTLNPIMDYNYYQWDADYYMPSLDATKNSWLKIKYAYNDAASGVEQIKFYASKDSALGETPLRKAEKTFDIVNGNTRDEIIRVNSKTVIYVVNAENRSVNMIKPSSYFSIHLNGDTDPLFMIDRIGYGNPDGEYADGIGYGVASVICIETSKEYVDETDYKLVYVQEDVSSTSSGFAADYVLKTGDVDETYYKYVIDDEAFLATVTFETVEEIFVSNTYRTNHLGGANLVAGLYLVNGENIVIDHKTVSTLTSESASERYLNHGNTKIAYDLWDVAGDDINLYDYKYIAIEGKEDLIGDKIKSIKFRFFEDVNGELLASDYKDLDLVDYMTENFCTITKPDEDDRYTWTYDYKNVRVLIIPNTMSGFDKNLEFENNTLAGIVVAEAIPETDANIVVAGGRCRAGETVDVTISLENNPGIAFMRLSVDYDSNAIKLVDVKDAGILGIEVHSDNLMADTYTLYWENSTIKNNITSNGTAVTLTFEINENTATGSYPVTVTYDNTNDDIMDVDFGEVYFNVINGAVEVVDFIYGDVNGDFEVTPVDSATLSRYLAKWTGYGEDVIDPDASDVNCDGDVTAVDSAMLSRHLAKWTGYETLPIEE